MQRTKIWNLHNEITKIESEAIGRRTWLTVETIAKITFKARLILLKTSQTDNGNFNCCFMCDSYPISRPPVISYLQQHAT